MTAPPPLPFPHQTVDRLPVGRLILLEVPAEKKNVDWRNLFDAILQNAFAHLRLYPQSRWRNSQKKIYLDRIPYR